MSPKLLSAYMCPTSACVVGLYRDHCSASYRTLENRLQEEAVVKVWVSFGRKCHRDRGNTKVTPLVSQNLVSHAQTG